MSSSSLFASLGAALQSFPSSSRHSSRSGSYKSNPGPSLFEAELSSQLEGLQWEGADYLSAAWLCRAMQTVLWTHAAVEGFVPDLQQALANGESKWLDDYLDDNIKLLDICRAIRDAIADIKLYHTHLQRSMHALQQQGAMRKSQLSIAMKTLHEAIGALKRKDDDLYHFGNRRSKLENCSSMLRRMGEKINAEDTSKGNVFMVIYAAQVTAIFICGILTSALSFKPKRAFSIVSVGGQSSWALALNSLQQRVREKLEKKRSRGANAQLEELDKSDKTVHSLHKILESCINDESADDGSTAMEPKKHNLFGVEIQQELVTLVSCAQELLHGLSQLELRINEIFKVLIDSRVALLDIYSYAA